MKKIMSNADRKVLETVNNNVDSNSNEDKIMTNEEMMKQIAELTAKIEKLETKKNTRASVEQQKYTISGRIQMSDVDKIIITSGDKNKFLCPQAKHSLRAIIELRDASSGTLTFTRKEWGEATENQVNDWSDKYKQTGDRINQWYHHQHSEYQFSEMEVNGEKIFS